jgi:phosphopantothenoylcysteine decarboxylase/phosphopantothenate--cysteine ligase
MKNKILFGLSGSIACFKACSLISKLVQNGFEVRTVATPSALQFVGPATLEGLTGAAVLSETFEPGHQMDHIHLNRWADLVILCPASANTLSKMAHGIADDLWTTLFLAHDFSKPYLIAPAMNVSMLQHPATQQSLQTLKKWGVTILETGEGNLACGEEGSGRLLEPDLLFDEIKRQLQPTASQPLRVLITSGGTREPIDGVRAITNTSSGRTGSFLADYFAERGHQVSLVRAESARQPISAAIQQFLFSSYHELTEQLRTLLQNQTFDLVIHAAAVSDYSVDFLEADGQTLNQASSQKLSSDYQKVAVHLKRNPKILGHLKSETRHRDFVLVGFKVTRGASLEERRAAVAKIAATKGVDIVVQNDLSEIDETHHRSVIYQNGRAVATCENKKELAENLEQMALQTRLGHFELSAKELL